MKWWTACVTWGQEERRSKRTRRADGFLDYLMNQGMLSVPDPAGAKSREVTVGMTECGMFAAKGMPQGANHTTTARGTSTQYVYGSGFYVYTDPAPPSSGLTIGVVRAIQH